MAEPYAAVILAGGQGVRMGGVDKGWQMHAGRPLVQHVLERLRAQTWPPAHILISANRRLSDYAALGVPVWPDTVGGFAGPLAGMLTALAHCPAPWLLTVPCDAPNLPLRLAQTLAQALVQQEADLAMAATRDATGQIQPEPVCCLLRAGLHDELAAFLASGGRQVRAWAQRLRCVQVVFDEPGDRTAFFNANTPADLSG